MNRLTTDKKIDDMSMVELAHNSCFAKDGKAWYRDYESAMDCVELTRRLMDHYCPYLDMEGPEIDFMWDMGEFLEFGPMEPEGLIALLYRNMWAMADLHDRLKGYEDAEENELLLRLPCKVGDTIFEVFDGKIRELRVIAVPVHVSSCGVRAEITCQNYRGACYPIGFYEVGKRVFLTREEAEVKLAELEATQ